ncbi:hypothetical protein M885DRAFT_565912 [Pelagophyceae sp. CCMP2097]|nr:hypothetical protein M885DRAFT_565912 [Pelagophyceae sp. CCMP2097]
MRLASIPSAVTAAVCRPIRRRTAIIENPPYSSDSLRAVADGTAAGAADDAPPPTLGGGVVAKAAAEVADAARQPGTTNALSDRAAALERAIAALERRFLALEAGRSGTTACVAVVSNGPGLAMSRSLGDADAKQLGVVATPTISHVAIPSTTVLIACVVCSDGVSDVLPLEDVLGAHLRLPQFAALSPSDREAKLGQTLAKLLSDTEARWWVDRDDDCYESPNVSV